MDQTLVITGTHLTPACELIEQLRADKQFRWKIIYLGRRYNSLSPVPSIESIVIPRKKIKFYGLDCGKFDRKSIKTTLKGLPLIFKGICQAFKILKEEKPNIIISFGGYVSVPVIIAGWLLKIPSITHEQTPTLSLATRINSFFVNQIALSFPHPGLKKAVVTGNLLRRELTNHHKKLFLTQNKTLIYVTAGNQGSHFLNNLIKITLPKLNDFYIIHQTGNIDYHEYKKLERQYSNYRVYSYLSDSIVGSVFYQAEIIISRAGANTSQEIVALKKKSILIPLPFSQQNEQLLNAQFVRQQLPDRTIIIPQSEINPAILVKTIKSLLLIAPYKLKPIKPNLKLLKLIQSLCKKRLKSLE
ncbi:MAG TPA: glycosyltransferase [Candidatus Woesebacteria bacterium]|nr:glycosyltransferase [Candidatus Woesebacteria bacterium]